MQVCALLTMQAATAQDILLLDKDSLLHALRESVPDTNRVLLLIQIGNDYERNLPDSAVYYYRAADTLSRRIHYPVGVLKYIANYTAVLNIQDKLDESLALNLEAVRVAGSIHSDFELAKAYGNTGAVYTLMHNYTSAIDLYLKSISLFERIHDVSRLPVVDGNLASIYADIGENGKAISYGLDAIGICRRTGDRYTLETALANTAHAYAQLDNYDRSLMLYDEARRISDTLNDQYVRSECLLGTCEVLYRKRLLEDMKSAAIKALATSKAIDHKEGVAKSLEWMAQYYLEKKQWTEARMYAAQAIRLSEQHHLLEPLQTGYSLMSDVSLATGHLEDLHHYRKLDDSTSRLMVSGQIIQTTQRLEAEYSLSKKEATIARLRQQQLAQQLSLQKGRTLAYVLSAMLVIILVAILLLYKISAQRKKLLQTRGILHEERVLQLEKEAQLIAVKSVWQGQEQERERLARELHDGLGGTLAAVKYAFTQAGMAADNSRTELLFSKTMKLLDSSVAEVRRVAHNLMPEALMRFGLKAALADYCDSIGDEGRLALRFQAFDVDSNSIPPEMASVVFRIVQELVQNILKHADATTALVQVVQSETSLSLTVEDDGRGWDMTNTNQSNGMGLSNVKNRIVFLKGTLDIISSPGKGTSVHIMLPNIIE